MLLPCQLPLLVAVLGMIRAASSNSSINGLIRRGQKRRTTEQIRADNHRDDFDVSDYPAFQTEVNTQSSSLLSSTSSQSTLPSRFCRRDDDHDDDGDGDDEIVQTIDGQHVISHPRLVPPGTGR